MKNFIYLMIILMVVFSSYSTLADQGITSDIHQKYQGKVIFSEQPIGFKKENEAHFKTEFTANSTIFGRVYFEKAINNHILSGNTQQTKGSYEIQAFIDDKPIEVEFGVFFTGSLSGDKGNQWTTFQFSPRPTEAKQGNAKDISENFTLATQGLSAGSHNVRFEFWGVQGQLKTAKPMAVGDFKLILKDGERITSQQLFPQDKFSGGNKEQLKKDIKNSVLGGMAKSWEEMLDVSIRSDWKISTYKNAPWNKYRKLTAIILWHDTDNDQLCNYTSYNFVQDAISESEWGSLKFQSFCMGCEEGSVECPK